MELADCIAEHRQYLEKHGLIASQRVSQIRAEFKTRLQESLIQRLFDTITPAELAGIIERITKRQIDPQQAVNKVLEEFRLCRPD